MAILVTGGAGYIGSHTVVELQKAGYDVVIVDNLVNAKADVIDRIEQITSIRPIFYELDVRDKQKLSVVFAKHEISDVIHFAGLKAVGESVEKPILYYDTNLGSTLTLLEVMHEHGVNNIVFSSSATVYGEDNVPPYFESMKEGKSTNPYGTSKVMIEWMLKDAQVANPKMNVAILRYFNPIGAHPSGLIGEDPQGIPNNLMPYIAKVATGELPLLNVFGDDYETEDGTGVRDYIHVVDLALGHLAALRKLSSKPGYVVYNLGSGEGTSVLELVKAFEAASGVTIKYKIAPRRAGDLAYSFANVDRANKELNWRTTLSIEDACADTWRWQQYAKEK